MKYRTIVSLMLVMQTLFWTDTVECADDDDILADKNHWIVRTASGLVEGLITTGFTKHEVYAFYGIPYAEPPIGQRRFKPPQPIKPWHNVLKAYKKPLPCYQQKMKYSWLIIRNDSQQIRRPWTEDCLTLNVWTPKPKIQDAPVLVVFHPGAFGEGSDTYPDGGTLSSDGQIVVVSMNYRLGAFGFLYLGVSGAPGNMGLLDQQLALKWVHDNIHNFGGKTDAVVLLGAGNAGAASVGFHLLSPGSANLYKTVDYYSGSPTCPWAFQSTEESLENARHLSDRLHCNKLDSDLELECLIKAHPEDIVDATCSVLESTSLQFLPTVDGSFLKESPLVALKAGHINEAAVISVSTTNEGSLSFWKANSDLFLDIEKGIDIEVFRKAVKRLVPALSESAMRAVESLYIGECGLDDSSRIRDAAIEVYSDVLINCCMNQFESFVAEKGLMVFPIVNDVRKQSDPSWVKSSHAITVEYMFGYPIIDDGYGTDVKNMVHHAMDWVSKTTRKKATELKSQLSVFDSKTKNYTLFDMSGMYHLSHYREDQCIFWHEIVPKLQRSESTCSYH